MKTLAEVHNDYIDVSDNLQYIDGYFSEDEMEEGKTLAVVCLDTYKVIFFDNAYRGHRMVEDAIAEIIDGADATGRKVEGAKKTLRENGYLADALWSVNNIRDYFADELSDEQVQELGCELFNNEGVKEQVYIGLDVIGCDKYGYTKAVDAEPILLADSHYGVYGPAKSLKTLLGLEFTISDDDKEVFAGLSCLFDEVKDTNPNDNEYYWEAEVDMELMMPTLYIGNIPYKYTMEDGDIWLWPMCRMHELS